jgi:hypothetical protein
VTTVPVSSPARLALAKARAVDAPRLGYLAFGGFAACVAVLGLLPGLLAPSLDSAVFALIGDRIAAGDVPYADVWDHKPPGIYLVNALGSLPGSASTAWPVAWGISEAVLSMVGVLMADTLRHLGWRWSAWIIGGLLVAELSSFPMALGGGLSETAALLPLAAALRFAVVGPGSWRRWLAIGLLLGLATSISLQALPAIVGVLAITIAWDRSLRPAGWAVAGVATAWAATLALLGLMGAMAGDLVALVRYNAAFTALSTLDSPLAGEALHAAFVLAPLVVLALIGTPYALASSRPRPSAIGALTWLAVGIGFVAIQGRMELHYAAPMVLPLAVLAPAALHALAPGELRSVRIGLIGGALIAAVAVCAILITTETSLALQMRGRQAARTHAVASWVRDHTATDAPIFVWGDSPEVYLQAERAPASRYVYLLPLLTPGFADTSEVSRVLDDWLARPPSSIVDAGSRTPGARGLPALLVPRQTAPLDGRNLDLLDPLRAFVRQNYALAATVDGWPIYLPKDAVLTSR